MGHAQAISVTGQRRLMVMHMHTMRRSVTPRCLVHTPRRPPDRQQKSRRDKQQTSTLFSYEFKPQHA